MQKWEYKQTGILTEKELNQLGNEGWEMVVLLSSYGSKEGFIFKRPKN